MVIKKKNCTTPGEALKEARVEDDSARRADMLYPLFELFASPFPPAEGDRKIQEGGLVLEPEVVVRLVDQRKHRRKVQQVLVPMVLETLGTQWEV